MTLLLSLVRKYYQMYLFVGQHLKLDVALRTLMVQLDLLTILDKMLKWIQKVRMVRQNYLLMFV